MKKALVIRNVACTVTLFLILSAFTPYVSSQNKTIHNDNSIEITDYDQTTIEEPEVNQLLNDPVLLDISDPWWNTDWPYRKEIIVNRTKVDNNLTNFPVLIDITDSDLQSKSQANGNDIVLQQILALS